MQFPPKHLKGCEKQYQPDNGRHGTLSTLTEGLHRGWFCFTHGMASSSLRSNSAVLPLNRWSDAFTTQSFFGEPGPKQRNSPQASLGV